MGCGAASSPKSTVLIINSLIHLLQTDQNKEVIKKLEMDGPQTFEKRLNFRGDTIMHLACSKNSIEIVGYLKKNGASFYVRNN
jgi:ankyrin repeat protein